MAAIGEPRRHAAERPSGLRWLEALALILILCLAAYLRLVHQPDNPGWYTDEATHIDIARRLLEGQNRYLAIGQSTLLFARLPAFELALAALLGIRGGGMDTLRTFTGVLGVIAVALLYLIVRRMRRGTDPTLALLSALMLAIYPQAILYSRMGFSYNLLTPLALLVWLGLWEYLDGARRGWLALAAAAIGIGAVSDLMMWVFVLPSAIVVWRRRLRDVGWAAVLMSLPFAVYAALMLVNAPQAFLFDVRFTLMRLNSLPALDQLASIARNYTILIAQDAWMAGALVGLFVLRPARLRHLSLIMFLLPILLLGRAAALHSLSFYYMIPLLPFVALGVATLVRDGFPWVARSMRVGLLQALAGARIKRNERLRRLSPDASAGVSYLTAILIVATPFAVSTVFTLERVQTKFGTVIDPFLIDPPSARAAADYVNARANDDDVVIASPAVAWLLHARAADFQMAVAATGRATVHLPADIPADRFVFDPRYTQARYVIVDNLWRNWGAVHMPELAAMLRDVETWPLVFSAGELAVYQNPAIVTPRSTP